MAISVTDLGHNSNNTGATVALSAISVPANVLIVAGTGDGSNAASGGSMTDSSSNSYTSIVSKAANNTTTNGFGQLWFFNQNGATLSSITYTKVTSGVQAGIAALYATGIATSSPLDTAVTASATGASAAPSVTGGTAAVSGELNVAFLIWDNNTKAFTQDTTHGWAAPLDSDTTNYPLAGGNQVNAGTAGKIFSPTLASPGADWAAFIVGFKASVAVTAKYGSSLLMCGVGTN